MPYTMQWGSTHPGCLIVLIDQSGSMGAVFGSAELGRGKRMSDMVASVVNTLLHEFIKSNTVGTVIKSRAEISVWGYGDYGVKSLLPGQLSQKDFVHLLELNNNPLRIDARTKKEMDDTGNIVEVPAYFPIWIEPIFNGGKRPMRAALKKASELATEWVKSHPDNYPPVIMNITDGPPTDGDIWEPCQELLRVHTRDGEALLFNFHITERAEPTIAFPNSPSILPNDGFIRLLFSVSSVIPDAARNNIYASTGNMLPQGARGFIFNGDVGSIARMFTFATIGAQAQDSPVQTPIQHKNETSLSNVESDKVQHIFIATRVQFDEAIRYPASRLKTTSPELSQGNVEMVGGNIPGPYGMQGGFAIVYRFRTQSGRLRALRVFTRQLDPDIGLRYEAIGRYFAAHLSEITAEFVYYDAGILVKNDHGSQAIFPLIDMEWVDGISLLDRIDQLCKNRDKLGLAQLVDRWVELLKLLHKSYVAHGDLSGNDVLVRPNGKLVLVDYDGVYVHDLAGRKPIVLGQPDYQHPQFGKRVFDANMDNFSGLAIYTALLALRAQPELWDVHARYQGRYLISENILFKDSDYKSPKLSKLFATLNDIDDQELKIAIFELTQACHLPIEHVAFPDHLYENHITADKLSPLKTWHRDDSSYARLYALPKFSRPLKVFLCHSSNDKPTVRKLYQMLLVDGIDPWLDKEKLLPGQDWDLEIRKAERNADVIIVCLSNESVKKAGYVQREIKFALEIAQEKPEGQIFVVPLKLEECDIPERLRRLHVLNFFEDRSHERLIDSLRQRAVEIGIILR